MCDVENPTTWKTPGQMWTGLRQAIKDEERRNAKTPTPYSEGRLNALRWALVYMTGKAD
jgi:hypothetical protein